MSEPDRDQVNGLAVALLLLPLFAWATMVSLMFVGVSVVMWQAAIIWVTVKAGVSSGRG